MTDATIWNQLLVWPILNLLVALYRVFETLKIPGPLGFSIIGLTVIIRLVLHPLMATQLRTAKKMSHLKPHLDELSKKHKDDKQALQQAHLALYKEHGINPAGGCLPLLLQFPVLISLYSVFSHVLSTTPDAVVQSINSIVYLPALKLSTLDTSFFGISLSVKPSEFQTYGPWLLAIPLATAAFQWYQSKLMTAPPATGKPREIVRATTGEKEEKKEDMASEMQRQMMLITPIMFGFFAFQFPLGLSLYWNLFSIFGIMQQRHINKTTVVMQHKDA